ncbi:MAG: hypothetical protein ABI844_01005 [Saprospiraceae bacterium]
MRPSERNEKKDRTMAFLITILVHAAILAALFFVALPPKEQPTDTQKAKTEMVKAEAVKSKA